MHKSLVHIISQPLYLLTVKFSSVNLQPVTSSSTYATTSPLSPWNVCFRFNLSLRTSSFPLLPWNNLEFAIKSANCSSFSSVYLCGCSFKPKLSQLTVLFFADKLKGKWSKTEAAIFICSGSLIQYILLTLYVVSLTLTIPFSAKTPSKYFRWAITDLFWLTFVSQTRQCKSLCASNLQASRFNGSFFSLRLSSFLLQLPHQVFE